LTHSKFYQESRADLIPITRADIKPGLPVRIVLKKDQKTDKLSQGIFKDILTKTPNSHHDIKVCLESGEIKRVKEIPG